MSICSDLQTSFIAVSSISALRLRRKRGYRPLSETRNSAPKTRGLFQCMDRYVIPIPLLRVSLAGDPTAAGSGATRTRTPERSLRSEGRFAITAARSGLPRQVFPKSGVSVTARRPKIGLRELRRKNRTPTTRTTPRPSRWDIRLTNLRRPGGKGSALTEISDDAVLPENVMQV